MLDQSREGRDFWRIVQMSTHDLLCEYFEDERVRMHFARIAGENLVSPDEKATGLGVFVFVGFMEAYGIGVPIGGSGRLTETLIACIRDRGGEVRAEVDVERVLTKNGRATGVVTTTGEAYAASDAVIGAIHPHHLGRMVEGLDPEVARAAAATQTSPVACITVLAALKAPLRFKAGAQVSGAMIELLPASYERLRRSFDDLRYGGFSRDPLIGLGSLSMFDPSRAPAGCAELHAWDYVPYQRPDGRSWDDTKRDYAERMLSRMREFIANIGPDDVLQYHCDSPADMERTSSSFQRGDLHGIAPTSWQSGSHRPTPELGQLTVPGIEGLYLVGPFQHPGGGVFGAGRATAVKLAEDLKIDLSRIAR
jgi:phytoene dehydrogenase-like protein